MPNVFSIERCVLDNTFSEKVFFLIEKKKKKVRLLGYSLRSHDFSGNISSPTKNNLVDCWKNLLNLQILKNLKIHFAIIKFLSN